MSRRTKSRRKLKPKPNPRVTLHTAARCLADLYCLWRFCGNRACRRGQACSGDPRSCLQALPLVPPDALLFAKGFDNGQRDFLSFDEMMARNEDEWAALEDWRDLVLATSPAQEERWPPLEPIDMQIDMQKASPRER